MSESLEAKVEPAQVMEWIGNLGTDASSTVPLLQEIQSEYGYLPRDAMDLVVKNTSISGSRLFGVATFYTQFRLEPVGRHLIKICHGTACHVTGADRLNTALNMALGIPADSDADTSENGSYTVEDVACIGCCSLAPAMVIDNETFGNLSGATSKRALVKHAKKNDEELLGV